MSFYRYVSCFRLSMVIERQKHGATAILVAVLLLLAGAGQAADRYPVQNLEQIRDAVREFVHRQNAELAAADDVEVGFVDPRLRLAPCPQALHLFFAEGSRPTGATTVGVRCLGPATWLIYVPTRVKLYRHIVVAARALPRKTVVREHDVKLLRRDVAGLTAGYLEDVSAAVGRVVKRPLTVGAILEPGALDNQRLVRRGEKVTIVARIGGLTVQMSGKALMGGAAGERVRVKNLSSGKVVEGTVSASGVVRVNL